MFMPSADELGRVYQPDLPINAGPRAFAAALTETAPVDGSAWRGWREDARKAYEAWQVAPRTPGALQMGDIIAHLRRVLPPDAIIANGAGNYGIWLHRFYRYRQFGAQLAPTSGSMGYGAPAAIAAKLVHPKRTVVAFAGDGCFLMTGQEFATAMQYNAAVIFIVVNNGMYGTIRMHQERAYPARVSGTDLTNPDFAAYARSIWRVRRRRHKNGGLCGRLRSGPGIRRALNPGAQDRSRSDHATPNLKPNPSGRPAGLPLKINRKTNLLSKD